MPCYVIRDGKLVEKHLAGPKYGGNGKVHNVIRDEMEPTRHMADNKFYTSKAKFRAATKAAGCVEVGNEIPTMLKPRAPAILDRAARRDAIRRAVSEIRSNGFRRE